MRRHNQTQSDTSRSAALVLLVHLMSETDCVRFQVTVHICLSRLLTSDCLSHLNVGHRCLDQLEATFSERSPELGPAVLEPDLRERKGVSGYRCKLIIDIINNISQSASQSVLTVCVPVFCPRPGPACPPAAPSAGFLDSSSSETQSPSHSPAGKKNRFTISKINRQHVTELQMFQDGEFCSD